MRLDVTTARALVPALAAASLLAAGCGAGDDTTGTPGADPALEDGAAGTAAALVELEEHDGSGLEGSAILTPDGEVVYVDVQVLLAEDEPAAEPAEDEEEALRGLAAEIRTGTCADPGETVRAIGRLQFGWAGTNVDVPMEELVGADHVVAVTRSETASAQEREAGDAFGDEDLTAPGQDDTAPAAEDVLEPDRELVACGTVELGGGDELDGDGDS